MWSELEMRSALAALLERSRQRPSLQPGQFKLLASCCASALAHAESSRDFLNASKLLNMVNTYYADGTPDALLIEEEVLLASPIWSNAAFWEAAVFESVTHERAKVDDGGLGWHELSEPERESRLEVEQNIAFGQSSCYLTQMVECGGVSTDGAAAFIDRLRILRVLVNDEHVEMLRMMLQMRDPETPLPPLQELEPFDNQAPGGAGSLPPPPRRLSGLRSGLSERLTRARVASAASSRAMIAARRTKELEDEKARMRSMLAAAAAAPPEKGAAAEPVDSLELSEDISAMDSPVPKARTELEGES